MNGIPVLPWGEARQGTQKCRQESRGGWQRGGDWADPLTRVGSLLSVAYTSQPLSSVTSLGTGLRRQCPPAEPGGAALPHTPCIMAPLYSFSPLSPLPSPPSLPPEVLLPRSCQWLWIHSLYPGTPISGPSLLPPCPLYPMNHACSLPGAGERGLSVQFWCTHVAGGWHPSPQTLFAPSCPHTEPVPLPGYSDHATTTPLPLKAIHGSLLPSL